MQWLAKLLLIVVSTALPCLGVELWLRLVAPPADTPELFRKLPSEIEYTGKPNAYGLFAGIPVAFNQLGLRDPERSPQPAPGTVRILALGDSVTFGQGVLDEQTYPRKTEELLNAARANTRAPVEVLNLGIPGYNTIHQLMQLREFGLDLSPQVVVIGFFYNDIELSDRQRGSSALVQQDLSFARRAKSSVNTALATLKENSLFFAWLTPRLGAVLRPLGMKGFGATGEFKDLYVDSNPSWRRVRSALLEIKQLTDERGIDLVVMIIPAMMKFNDANYQLKEYHQAVVAFCQANAIKYLDLLPAFWGLDGYQFWILPTDAHPNAHGQQIMAEALATFLTAMLPPA